MIEDLHWADDATVDFVRYLGRRIGDARILLVLTARSDEPQARTRLRRSLADIPTENVVRVDVPLLTEQAVAELCRRGRARRGDDLPPDGGQRLVCDRTRAQRRRRPVAGIGERRRCWRAPTGFSAAARAALDAVSIFPRRAEIAFVGAMLPAGIASPEIEECAAAGHAHRRGRRMFVPARGCPPRHRRGAAFGEPPRAERQRTGRTCATAGSAATAPCPPCA